MAVGLNPVMHLQPVPGVRIGIAEAGIKYAKRKDLVLFELDAHAVTSGVFTKNAFCAAPVVLAKRHLGSSTTRYWVINTGNANAGTGENGMLAAQRTCDAIAEIARCASNQVLPFSTGVIGEPLPVDRLVAALPAAFDNLDENNWVNAAHGIMTTDTLPKGSSRRVKIGDADVTVTGIAKGAGMIHPNMATMLSFIATDAKIDASVLQECLRAVADKTFNRVTIDGDTSTNDACMLVATQRANNPFIRSSDEKNYGLLFNAVLEVCRDLSQAIVRDGEGATKFMTIHVVGGRSENECAQVGFTIAHSPLVKTAFFASDPNWGRILAAIGRSGIEALDVANVNVYLDEVCIVRGGGRASDYTEARGQQVLKQSEITIRVELNRGSSEDKVWTCDFSYDYVRINAEYRT